jgi:uroporphyrinogen-III synthase
LPSRHFRRLQSEGDRTAHEMQARGWMPECVSEEASAHGLVQALQTRSVKGARILFPCSAIAEPTFPEGMRAAGALVDLVHVYTTEPVWLQHPLEKPRLARQLAEELRRGCIATCASPSAARALAELAQEAAAFRELQRTPIVVIGTTTARAVSDLGLQPVDAGGRSLGFMARKAVEIGRQMV